MNNLLFERCFISTACEYGVKQYGSVMAYAKKIWPEKDDKNAAQTLYAIQRKSSKTGKPQGLPLHLAVLMVDLLTEAPSFPSFCFEISERIRLGWGADQVEEGLTHDEKAFSPTGSEREEKQPEGEGYYQEGSTHAVGSGQKAGGQPLLDNSSNSR